MSPEQHRGDARIDGRSDLYSLGCVVYEMLAGRPPFEASTIAAVTYAHVNAPPPSVRKIRPDVPADVDAAIRRALAKDPADRPGTSDEFTRALGVDGPRRSGHIPSWMSDRAGRIAREPVRSAAVLLLALVIATVVAWPSFLGTTSPTALRSYRAGLEALDVWDLARADSSFAASIEREPAYARAHFRLAQTRNWMGLPRETWAEHAERARRIPRSLPRGDRAFAEALGRLGSGDLQGACAAYERLIREGTAGFASHYGLGECTSRDQRVDRDAASPTGWSFRTSYWQAVQAYRSAFMALADEVSELRRGAFSTLVSTLPVRGNIVREGRSPDGEAIYGHLVWVDVPASVERDSIAALPTPPSGEPIPAARTEDAFQHLRRAQMEIASRWVDRFPASAEAHQAWSYAAESLGLDEALPAIRRARDLTDARYAAEVIATEVWLTIKHGLPNDTAALARARANALDLISHTAMVAELTPERMAGLAAVAGQPLRAADLLARGSAAYTSAEVLARAERIAEQLRVLSAVGADGRLLDSLDAEAVGYIAFLEKEGDRVGPKNALLGLPAILAFPEHVSRRWSDPDMTWGGIARGQLAMLAGDSAAARSVVDEVERNRRGLAASRTTVEIVHAEARLIAALGDSMRAAAWLGATLDSLAFSPPGHIRDRPERAAALVPSLITMARLARATLGPAHAARWAAAARALWGGGDELAARALASLPDTHDEARSGQIVDYIIGVQQPAEQDTQELSSSSSHLQRVLPIAACIVPSWRATLLSSRADDELLNAAPGPYSIHPGPKPAGVARCMWIWPANSPG
jgi:tetratricopeptide (TPR) repeat protein